MGCYVVPSSLWRYTLSNRRPSQRPETTNQTKKRPLHDEQQKNLPRYVFLELLPLENGETFDGLSLECRLCKGKTFTSPVFGVPSPNFRLLKKSHSDSPDVFVFAWCFLLHHCGYIFSSPECFFAVICESKNWPSKILPRAAFPPGSVVAEVNMSWLLKLKYFGEQIMG